MRKYVSSINSGAWFTSNTPVPPMPQHAAPRCSALTTTGALENQKRGLNAQRRDCNEDRKPFKPKHKDKD